MMIKKTDFLIRFMLIVFCSVSISKSSLLIAQTGIHASVSINYELTEGYWPGYDFTLIYGRLIGLRMTIIPDFMFSEDTEIVFKDNTLSSFECKGDLKMPMVLKTLDYRSLQGAGKVAFDFLTAYIGIGYNELETEITKKVYSTETNNLHETTIQETVKTPVYSTAFGMYGGEKFLFIDTRLMYIKGESKKGDVINEQVSFDRWMVMFSIGIGF